MNLINQSPSFRRWATAISIAAAVCTIFVTSVSADMYRPGTNAPGGVPAAATVAPVILQGTNFTLCWYGMQGWYGLEATNVDQGGGWFPVGRTAASDHAWCFTAPKPNTVDSFLFRLNQANAYAGSGACAGCHGDKYNEWFATKHASAFTAITNEVAQTNELVYFTAGYNQQSGFVSSSATPHLKNVSCENCHGPAAWHKYSDHDLVRPAVSIDPAICGGCHAVAERPTYNEYITTKHAQVNGDIKYGIATPGVYYSDTINIGGTNLYGYYVTTNTTTLALVTNRTTGIIHSLNGPQSIAGAYPGYDPGQDRAVGCGICHSGASRMAMIKDYEARLEGRTNALELATAIDAGSWGPTCAVCHDPHSAENEGQMRNPLWSTNYYTMATTADKRTVYTTNFMGAITTNVVFYSAAFANLYDPSIQVCGQCHNSRGGRWDGLTYGFITNGVSRTYGVTTNYSFRVPHHSPQYNILSGNIQPDYLTGVYGTNYLGCHSLNTKGCAACHVHAEESPVNTGHSFEPEMTGCSVAGCHDINNTQHPDAALAKAILQLEITNGITALVSNLNNWSFFRARAIFGAAYYNTYKTNSWEYSTAGDLKGYPNNGPATVAEQLLLPEAILQARFNLYMLAYGKSLGIHNPQYSRYLLQDASNKVYNATYPLPSSPLANFTAPTNVARKASVPFSNLSEYDLTSFVWDFGDTGTNATSVNPSKIYTNNGTYTVTLTAYNGGGYTNILTRTFYITVVDPPVAAFSVTPSSGMPPLTVTFTNLSANANSYSWSFGDGTSSTTNGAFFTHTYPNAVNYSAVLTAVNTNLGAAGTYKATNVISMAPSAAFTAGPTNGIAPLTVYFTNSSARASSYIWTFGDGKTSTNANPSNVYTNAGNYTVTLKAINFGVTNTLTRTNYIGAFNPPVASFTVAATNQSGSAPLTVYFTNLSANATGYFWDFGDGNTSAAANPANTYTNVGSYTVSLQAYNLGVTNTLTAPNYITVTP